MSELRQRRGEGDGNEKLETAGESDHVDSEEEKVLEEKYVDELAKTLPQGTDKTPEILDSALSGLSSRWRNWVIRGIFTWLMIGAFCLLIYGGPLALMITVLCVQVKCFEEIINIGYAVYRVHGLPWFRSLSWYFLLTSNYFFYGENLIDYFGVVINRTPRKAANLNSRKTAIRSSHHNPLSTRHMTLRREAAAKIDYASVCLIWFIVPVSMIICNDVMAYVFGFFFGKTPLIKLSPKKTWEGFIGGGVSTVAFGLVLSYLMSQYPYLVCPIEYSDSLGRMTMDCEPSQLFRLHEYTPPQFLQPLMKVVGMEKFNMYPFMIHSLALSIFSSVIGPFGGFFASGFKRAFKIKDFGDVIPGHGGIMDRFDCQFLMATFVNVYITSFIRTATPQKLLQQVYNLKPEQQLQLFYALKESLEHRNILNTLP
ncbi:hypothetical protein O3G_MSEX013394 [Manduca sexta]|uniref:Phosphatidate cytidylyltransferase n=1 Tax=Manduca sexta TaxID=7130 RepID=A0A921ZSK0_MANSE|nr:hypothetical protein O3G_MSEX013394 [Manduca sexta]